MQIAAAASGHLAHAVVDGQDLAVREPRDQAGRRIRLERHPEAPLAPPTIRFVAHREHPERRAARLVAVDARSAEDEHPRVLVVPVPHEQLLILVRLTPQRAHQRAFVVRNRVVAEGTDDERIEGVLLKVDADQFLVGAFREAVKMAGGLVHVDHVPIFVRDDDAVLDVLENVLTLIGCQTASRVGVAHATAPSGNATTEFPACVIPKGTPDRPPCDLESV